jgi:hypothetical protein
VWLHRDCVLGGTAIRATGGQRDSCRRRGIDEPDAELEHLSVVSGLATLLVAAAAVLLAALPAIVGLRLLDLPFGWVGAGLGFVGAALGGVKLIAIAWAVGGRLFAGRPAGQAIATAD